uniref:Uncharacterized protein n=1 Tax=Romanomermis culicivorax TaxID=13658 RepID=A0A915K7I9_ROMCU
MHIAYSLLENNYDYDIQFRGTGQEKHDNEPNVEDKVLPSDESIFKVLIDEGETLVRMSREPVQYTLESIVRSWIEKDPEVKRNPPTILVKLEQLVSKLRIMVNFRLLAILGDFSPEFLAFSPNPGQFFPHRDRNVRGLKL